MEVLDELRLWIDPVKRPGPEAMAVDEWLLESAEVPVLRVYRWLGDWGSIGYFGELAAARASFPGVEWVRRWSGGGTVDHRADWTYSLIVPAGEPLARQRGDGSYRVIHAALREALAAEEIDARLSTGAGESGSTACFENPVSHDLVSPGNQKLAGAGQRRSRHGLLHQGSVAVDCEPGVSQLRAERLAAFLSKRWQRSDLAPPADEILEKVHRRYALAAWTERR